MSNQFIGKDQHASMPGLEGSGLGGNNENASDPGLSGGAGLDIEASLDPRASDRQQVLEAEIPGVLTKDLFMQIANHKSVHCISIYLSAAHAGVDVTDVADAKNLKNQLQEAEQRLLESGMHNDREIEILLEPGYKLVEQEDFLKVPSKGLAVFIAENFFRFIRMPVQPPEQLLMIESSFYVTPLVSIMASAEYFYVVVISKQSAKLFRGDAWGMEFMPLNLPQSIQEVKRLSDLDATTFRSGANGSRGPAMSQEGVYHGTGGGNPDGKDNMRVYFEAVDDIIWKEVLHDQHVPLVIAAVEYEIPIYKSICDYAYVWPEGLTGNRDSQDTESLYADAKALLQPYFEERKKKALELYMNNSANGKTSSILADVIPATYFSQVSHLFVAKGTHLWGAFDEMANEMQLHDTQTEDSEDLIDNAVEKTLAMGGDVFLLDREEMPAESPVAAIMRF